MNRVLVVDLEATCTDVGMDAWDMEVIEIGAVWATPDGVSGDRFQSFVRPMRNPKLTSFCTNLTGITQDDVDGAPCFPAAAFALRQFAEAETAQGNIWVSWGAYDRRQLERDSSRHGVGNPLAMSHQNVKRMFAKAQKIGKEVGMAKACDLAGLVLLGTHHRALDDALNIARLLPWAFGDRELPGRTASRSSLSSS
ncbi:3'-5' exonuclease [Achromobacter deleyi]|uniref:3'-5' exonuclease n=1 Tax=Achromobacter deleyi TaxID=1353891 RepID=UPI001492948B|nr:3'-5' exonuclease [Achromobacter deleyi]QVQ24725.1 exonuclease domain-containing protein [Achromobacter deleyi]UIP20262.1 exonuclease domain-containing protein [Achromobacter deleyi]